MPAIKCTCCEGKGTVVCTSTERLSKNEKKVTEIILDCIWCHGKGTLTEKEAEELNNYKNMWCKCENEGSTVFFNDGEHPKMYKHHYRCSKCGKVLQLG